MENKPIFYVSIDKTLLPKICRVAQAMGYVPMQGSLSTRGQCRDNRRIWETVVDATDEEFVGPNRLELPVYSEITLSERDARTLLNALGF